MAKRKDVLGELPGETWCPVVGYEKYYEVSSLGRLRDTCYSRIVGRSMSNSGYWTVALNDGEPKRYSIHRIVAAAFIGPCPDGYEVNHRDGDKTNNEAENLEYVTRTENVRHYWGRRRSGQVHSGFNQVFTADSSGLPNES